ncbi:hypothetical protein GQ53DRAFT_641392, partial [Thozetella sp. PMI_491]
MGDILGYSRDEEEPELDTTTTPVPKGPFSYEPLNPTNREVRLLRLAKPPGKDGLHLSLTSCPLDQAPPFMAVSYCWGDAKQMIEIDCNRETLAITASLDYALKRVFNWKPDLVLWADGICINQEDMDERASQVKLMGEIYSRAQSTVAYLGEALAPDAEDESTPDLDQSGFALMLQLNAIWSGGEDYENHSLHDHQPRTFDEWAQMQIPDAETIDGLKVWLPLLHMCAQPWFSRSWVLQEVALAKNVYV